MYRSHRIFHCARCKTLHKSPEELEQHGLAIEGCKLIDQQPVEGITGGIEKKLRSRKKLHRDQSEVERWQEIYQILFPGEAIPAYCKHRNIFKKLNKPLVVDGNR